MTFTTSGIVFYTEGQLPQAITTLAGTGASGFGGDGGPATQARLNWPQSAVVAADGSLYFSDGDNGRVRKISPSGVITTVAGGGYPNQGIGDGLPATEASLNAPWGLALGPDGSLYIGDQFNYRIRRVMPNGVITTVVGGGQTGSSGDGGPATQATLNRPFGVAVAPDGTLYVSEHGSHRIRRVAPNGVITTVVGTGVAGYSGDGGPATSAQLNSPEGIALGPDGSLYIADLGNHRIRRLSVDGIITTVAGTGTSGTSGDGGPAAQARLASPTGVTVGPDGSLYVTVQYGDARVRRVGPDGIIRTVAGGGNCGGGSCGDNGPATQAQLNRPVRTALGPDGSLYIVELDGNRIRRIGPLLPGFSEGDLSIPSQDGDEDYLFSGSGRHLRTLDALTGALIFNRYREERDKVRAPALLMSIDTVSNFEVFPPMPDPSAPAPVDPPLEFDDSEVM